MVWRKKVLEQHGTKLTAFTGGVLLTS